MVNAAEGEPGSFKDRTILQRDPYRVIEGALIAAHAVGADSVIIATKASFIGVVDRLQRAVAEADAEGWTAGVPVTVFAGPDEYLYGEETALLEVIDGRPPFPRIAPPYREGVDEVFDDEAGAESESRSAAGVEMAGPTGESVAPPTLAGNAETFANLPAIVVNGADWFRELGTTESPGTIVCTVSGATGRHGVGEVALGTPLREVLESLGGGARPGHEIVAVMSGVANPLLPASALDTPVSYEAMQAAGSGLGAAGFIVFDDGDDLVAVAAGVAHFLAVESCGQCRHCKDDGLALADLLRSVAASDATDRTLDDIATRLDVVAEGARCNLATQQQVVVGSILQLFPDSVRGARHRDGDRSRTRLHRRDRRRSSTAVPSSIRADAPSNRTGATTRSTPASGPPTASTTPAPVTDHEETLMPEPTPETPAEAGVVEETPELGNIEGARILGNDARQRLHADGFTDAQIDAWAETFIAEESSGSVDEFVAWIARQEAAG